MFWLVVWNSREARGLPGVRLTWQSAGRFVYSCAMARKLFPMNWCDVDNGCKLDLLCKTVIFGVNHDAHQMETVYDHKRFVLSGLIDAGFESYSIFGATMMSQFPFPVVRLEPTSVILGHKDVTWDAISSVIDLCSGFGGMSQGVLPCGFHTVTAVDQNEKMVQLFSRVSSATCIVGDVGDKQVIHEV